MSIQSKIIAIATGIGAPILILLAAFDVLDLDADETTAVLAVWVATVALVVALVEHFRASTPTEWAAIGILIPPEITAILGALVVFHAITGVQSDSIYGVVAVVLAGLGLTPIVRSKVYSPETHDADMAVARSAALRGPAAGDVVPPGA